MIDREKRYQSLATRCVKDAKTLLGDGWSHVSKDLQWGLVCANIVALIETQDESIPSDNVRAMHAGVVQCAREMIFGE